MSTSLDTANIVAAAQIVADDKLCSFFTAQIAASDSLCVPLHKKRIMTTNCIYFVFLL